MSNRRIIAPTAPGTRRAVREVLTGIDLAPLLEQLADPDVWGLNDVCSPMDNPRLSAARPIVADLMHAVHGETLGGVSITRKMPGKQDVWHVDEYCAIHQWVRYLVPIVSSVGCRFMCGGNDDMWLRAGSAYWFDCLSPHFVANDSADVRIMMLVDLRPFAGWRGSDAARLAELV